MSEDEAEKSRNPRMKWRETLQKNVTISNKSAPSKISTSQRPKIEVTKGQHLSSDENRELEFESSIYMEHEAEIEKLFQQIDDSDKIVLSKYNASAASDMDTDCKTEQSSIENTPMCSPIQIKSDLLRKRICHKVTCLSTEPNALKIPASPVASITSIMLPEAEELPTDMFLCSDKIPPSPVPPMSPETTKLYEMLANEAEFYNIAENSLPASPSFVPNEESGERLTSSEAFAIPIKIPNPLLARKKSVVPALDPLPGEEPGEKSIEAPPFSPLTPRPTSTLLATNDMSDTGKSVPIPDDVSEDNCWAKPSYSDDSVQDPDYECNEEDDSSSDNSSKKSDANLTIQAISDSFNKVTNSYNSTKSSLPASPSLVPNEKCGKRITSIEAFAITIPDSLVLPGEIPRPGEQITSAKALPIPMCTSNPLLADHPLLIPGEKTGKKSVKFTTDSSLMPREVPGTTRIEYAAPKSQILPEDVPGDPLVLPGEEPGEKSIEAPPFSPLTPRPTSKLLARNNMLETGKSTPVYEDEINENDDTSCDSSSEKSISILTVQTDLLNEVTNDLDTTETIEVETIENTTRPVVQDNREPSSFQQQETPSGTSQTGTQTESSGRPRKGRKRKYGNLTREERKKRKYMNLSYVNSNKKIVDPKPFLDWKCGCKKECHELLSVEKRLSEFNKFYALGSYNAQNMYLAACVKEQPVKRSYVTTNTTNVSKKKTFSRKYLLQGIEVCREMFVKTLQTTPKRINTSLCRMRLDGNITDKRGLQAGLNRVAPECELFLINIIKKLPKYVSHYRRSECNDAEFLRPDMTFPVIYKQYCTEAAEAGIQTVSYSKAKHIFLTKFNLRTKPLKKDTCNKCDSFANKKILATGEDKVRIETEHSMHLEKAKSLQQQLKADMLLAKDEHEFTETITYDLEKTLPLPRIPTNIVFYKRQLWVYNLGIHTGSDDQAHCNVWVEGEAGRGAQEVASCLIKHVSERLKSNVRHLILWSDSCGGQNRNIKLTLMLKALLSDHPTLQRISIRFLESGHSFLPNDTDFGRIECALKVQQRLYTPADYIEVMKNCKKNKPMRVHRMNKDDFFSSTKLENIITNRKKAVDGSKVSWLNTKELMLKKEDMFSIYMRTNLEADFTEVNIKKNVRGRQPLISKNIMEPLWPNGKPIPRAKLDDIRSLLHLIPQDVQDFYKSFTGDERIVDDVDGFSGSPDFELDIED